MAKKTRQKRRIGAGKVSRSEPPFGLERLFTVDQIAQLGARCRASLYDDINAGRLKAVKFGRSTRISESAYREYIESAPPSIQFPRKQSRDGH
jgi:excisionase family DNA binding protein